MGASPAAHLSCVLSLGPGDNWANPELSNRGGPLPAQSCRICAMGRLFVLLLGDTHRCRNPEFYPSTWKFCVKGKLGVFWWGGEAES